MLARLFVIFGGIFVLVLCAALVVPYFVDWTGYRAEFERLLDQVGRDDRGQVLTRTYLASDTGKVYTLLAHASGRLG